MKTYRNEHYGFELDLPEEWALPLEDTANTPSAASISFGCSSLEAFNIQIGRLSPIPPLDQTERDLSRYIEDKGYMHLALNRLTVAGKQHVWARYYMWEGVWTKKYMIVLGETEYAMTATCFDQKMLLAREKVWDATVASFRLLKPADQASEPQRASDERHSAAGEPHKWVARQIMQAISYVHLKRGDRADNLRQAIDHYQQALSVFTRQAYPKDWAAVHNDLGEVYRNLSLLVDREENLAQAIVHYQQTLEVSTRQNHPELWAAAHNNLGIAYANGTHGDQVQNIEQAIDHCQQALEVYTRTSHPDDWAMTQNNLAQAYRKRIYDDRAANIEQAIFHYQQALEIQAQQADREQWAGTQNNLALAYYDRIRGDEAENIAQVIRHSQHALEVFTQSSYPKEWAIIQTKLAIAYQELNRIEKTAERARQTLYCA